MRRYFLLLILLLSLVLRLLLINEHPVGFTPDEASFGYDAYCLLKTGKDQWGRWLPISLRSFGDGKMPVYAYLTIPSVAMLGLTEQAVRLPNAILGSAAVGVTYLLVKKWRGKTEEALMAALLLAISPWHVPMSRGAFEANLTTFFMPLGVWLFLAGLKKNKWLVGAGIIFGLNLFTYHAARLVTPIVAGYLVWQYREQVRNRAGLLGIGVFLCLAGLAGVSYLQGAGSRVASAGIIKLAGEAGRDRYGAVMVGVPDIIARVFNNKLTHLVDLFGQNYSQYFSAQFLFANGPGEYTYGMVPGRGVLYLIEVIFLGIFGWMLVRGKVKSVGWLLVWLVIAPVPAALALGPGYAANRAAVMMPAIQIISAIGAIQIFKSAGKWTSAGLVIIWLILFGFFAEDYWVQQRARGAKAMIDGAGEVVNYVREVEEDYAQVIVSKKISEPQIYFAFYGKIDPRVYQDEAESWDFQRQGLDWVDQMPEYKLGKVVFKNIDWERDKKLTRTLLAGTAEEFSEEANVIKKIYYPNGEAAYWIVSTENKAFVYRNK